MKTQAFTRGRLVNDEQCQAGKLNPALAREYSSRFAYANIWPGTSYRQNAHLIEVF